MTTPEFSRTVRIDTLGSAPRNIEVEAGDAERAALAARFDLISIERLHAQVALVRNGDSVTATGALSAAVTQSCVGTGEPVPAALDERFTIIFRPTPSAEHGEEEIELSAEECDVVFYDGALIDVGEAVAETLSLSLDPWPRAPHAEEVLKAKGVRSEEEAEAEEAEAKAARSPFAALKGK